MSETPETYSMDFLQWADQMLFPNDVHKEMVSLGVSGQVATAVVAGMIGYPRKNLLDICQDLRGHLPYREALQLWLALYYEKWKELKGIEGKRYCTCGEEYDMTPVCIHCGTIPMTDGSFKDMAEEIERLKSRVNCLEAIVDMGSR
jgi:hypothetical protein